MKPGMKKLVCLLMVLIFQTPVLAAVNPSSDVSHMAADGNVVTPRSADMTDDSLVPLRRATIVARDPTSYVDEFSYMAAVPYSVFTNGSSRYMSPLLFYDESQSLEWLIEDWADYLESDPGETQLTVIGGLSTSTAFDIGTTLGTTVYPWIAGNSPAETAAMLALSEWRTSNIAVFALAEDNFTDNTIAEEEAQITLSGVQSIPYSPSLSISSANPVYLDFDVPAGTAWIEGSVNWTGSEYFTHILTDAHGRQVDYSVRSQTYWERFYPYLDSPVPLNFWVPNTGDGQWTLTIDPATAITRTLDFVCDFTFHPGFTRTISVPSGTRSMEVDITWDNTATDLNLALLDPTGRLVQWAPSGSIVSSPDSESVVLEYPSAGDWTVVVAWMNAQAENNVVDLSWNIERLPEGLQGHLESAANAAVLASLLNAPLLYVSESSIPEITQFAIDRLGVNVSYLVDPENLHDSSLYSALDGFSVVANLYNYQLLTQWIRFLSDSEDVVLSVPVGGGDEFFASAAYSGAYHGAPVYSLCGEDNRMTTIAEETWYPYLVGPEIDVYVTKRYTTRTENGWYDERIPHRYSMTYCADEFTEFLNDRGAYNASAPQEVVIVSPLDIVKPSFDRSLQSHFSPGRIPAEDSVLASVIINRGSLHRLLFGTAESSDSTLVSMYAYTDGSYLTDNNYGSHLLVQYANSSSMLQGAGFQVESHVGYQEVFSVLSSQPALWTLSTHGTLTRYPTDPPTRPGGEGLFSLRSTDAPYGVESESDRDVNNDNLINPPQYADEESLHRIESTASLESEIGSIGSPIVILTACLLGGSRLPLVLMTRGAVAVYASPRTVYFQTAALLSLIVLEGLTGGNATGESLSKAISMVSYDYADPPSSEPADYANQHILFGDPSVKLYEPSTTIRIPSVDPRDLTIGSRLPGRGVEAVAGIGSGDYLPDTFDQMGIEYNYYDSTNLTDFGVLLPLRRCVITEPGIAEVLQTELSSISESVRTYVETGGVLGLLGVSGNLSWSPWSVTYNASLSGSTIEIVASGHPLMSLPNTLTDSVDFEGTLSGLWANFSVLAVGGNEAVIVASTVGSGKVAMTTTNPSGVSRNTTIANLLAWGDMPSIVLRDIKKNQEIIWSGDRVIIRLQLTSRIGVGLPGLSIGAWMNSSDVAANVQEVGEGAYTLTLNESWTTDSVGVHDLRLHVQRAGYDTLDVVLVGFMYVRPSPLLLLIVAGGIIAAVAIGVAFLGRKRGIGVRTTRPAAGEHIRRPSPSSDDEKRQKEEEKRRKEEQKKRDREFDPKELFGV